MLQWFALGLRGNCNTTDISGLWDAVVSAKICIAYNVNVWLIADQYIWTQEKLTKSHSLGHQPCNVLTILQFTGLDIKHLVHVPIGHVVLKVYVPCKNFPMPRQNLYKPCKSYVYCWESKYMPRLKNHFPSLARNHRRLCALGQDLHAPGMP